MSNVEFINDIYTINGLKLPMVHFERYMCYLYLWCVWNNN